MSNIYKLFDEVIQQVNNSIKTYPQKLSTEVIEQLTINLGYERCYYYASLTDAMNDINAEPKILTTLTDPKVMVQFDYDGTPIVVLLDDCEESGIITIPRSAKLFLNTYELSINGGHLAVTEGHDLTIFGGSEDNKGRIITTPQEGKVGGVVNFKGRNLACYNTYFEVSTTHSKAVYALYISKFDKADIINCDINASYSAPPNGSYYSSGIHTGKCGSPFNVIGCNINCFSDGMPMYGILSNDGNTSVIDDCDINVQVTSQHVAIGVVNQSGSMCNINNSIISAVTNSKDTSYRQCVGVLNEGNLVMDGCECELTVDGHYAHAVENYINSNAVLRNCNLKVTIVSETGAISVKAVVNLSHLECYDSVFWTDARYGNNGKPMAIAVFNQADAYLSNCTVTGTHSGLQHSGKSLYIDGGMYTGTWHGGVYIATDPDSVTHINNAVLRDGHYDGQFEDPEQTLNVWYYWGAIYIGGSNGRSDIVANLDGCTFEGFKHAICMRGSLGEMNNTAKLSNCTFAPRGNSSKLCTINYHRSSHHVHVGVGCNITEEEIFHESTDAYTKEEFIPNDEMLVFTNDIYRGIYNGREMNDTDAVALSSLLEA